MPITREAAHEAGHATMAQQLGWEVKGVNMMRHGDAAASVRNRIPEGAGATTPESLAQLAYGSALSLAAGAGAELAQWGLYDEAGCADDLAKLTQLYHDERTVWRWARQADIFEGVMTVVAEQALLEDAEAFKGVANLLQSHDGVGQHDIDMMGPFTKWMVGHDWRRRFWDMVHRANLRLDTEIKALDERIAARDQQRQFASRHAQLQQAIAARVPEAERTTFHAPRVYTIMDAWGR